MANKNINGVEQTSNYGAVGTLVGTKGQLISKYLLEKIVWTKIATKKFDHFCPGGQIKKIMTLYYIKYPIIDIRKCLYFFDLTARAEIVKFFRC